MKILYITTIGSTMIFFKSLIGELVKEGHTVDIASNDEITPVPEFYNELGCKQYHIDCTRSPLNSGNIKCIKQIKQLVEKNEYDIVHCHTPIAAFCTRLACRNIRKKRVKSDNPLRVFYTAHGFHFYKGAPKKNWIVFYPIEKLCARWTDTLITINKEDYNLAKNKFEGLGKSKQFTGCKIEYVPGVGVDVEKFANTVVDRKAKRAELEIPEDAFLLLSVGELNTNKNHQIVIRALGQLRTDNIIEGKNIHYVVAGQGDEKENLTLLARELCIEDRVHLLGQRKDCPELYKVSNLLIHPSIREGLPVCVMEALSAGLICTGSNIRGNQDLIAKENLFYPYDKKIVAEKIINHSSIMKEISNFNSSVVSNRMKEIYFE